MRHPDILCSIKGFVVGVSGHFGEYANVLFHVCIINEQTAFNQLV